jgi:RimJ/RimL family protein N-acetyltransferase
VNLQPTLRGRLVTLRPLVRDDFEAVHAAASDPRVWEQHPRPDRHQRAVFQEFLEGALVSRGAFVVEDSATHAVLGSTRFYDVDAAHLTVCIGYTFLAYRCWGRGHNPEMKALLLAHARDEGMRAVFFHVGAHNRRSRVAVERLGATQVPSEATEQVVYRLEMTPTTAC